MWIDLDGLVNLRDVGGIPTSDGGKIIPGRLLRSDNLQTLTAADVDQLLGLGLTDVIDLRSDYEAEQEGPGPLVGSDVRITSSRSFGSGSSAWARPSPTYAPRCCLKRRCPGSTSNPVSNWTTRSPRSTSPTWWIVPTRCWLRCARSPGHPALHWCTVPRARTVPALSSRWPYQWRMPTAKRSSMITRRAQSVSKASSIG